MLQIYRIIYSVSDPRSHSPAGALPLLGLLIITALTAFGWVDGIPLPLPRLLFPAAAFLAYGAAGLTATRAAHRRPAGLTAQSSDNCPAGVPARPVTTLALIWAIAILARLALLPLAPELSDDIYRYLWDGHLLTQGVNPYAHPPGDEALAALRTPWHGKINHPEVPTIYPPLSQLLFGAVAGGAVILAGGPIIAAKLVWLCFDLGCGLLLHRIARRTGRNPAPVLIWYLWSPLLIVETAWSAHFDSVGLFLMAALILAVQRREGRPDQGEVRRSWLPGTLLAAATLVKFAPVAALPALVRRQGPANLLAFTAVCAVFYFPFVAAGPVGGVGFLEPVGFAALTEGLRTYARHWSANEGAFAVIAAVAGDPVQARVAATALVLAVVAWVSWRRYSVERALLWILGAGLLLSPTVHPWYVLWILPMAALRGSHPFLLLGGLVFLGYWGLASYEASGVWPQPFWNRTAIWLPVWLMLLWGCLRRLPRQGTRGDPEPRRPANSRPQPDRQISPREERDEGQ